jgi:hypothetical protein
MRTGILVCTMLGVAATAGVVACGTESTPFDVGCGFDNDASPGVQGELAKVSGDGAVGEAGDTVRLTVHLVGIDGESLCFTDITWTPAANSGTVIPAQVATYESGNAETVWTLGETPGTQTVTATVDAAVPALSVTFTATVTGGGGSHPKAQISAYNGTLTPGVIVTMQTPYDGEQTFGPLAPSTQESDSLQVEVGQPFQITAVVGAQSVSVTCITGPAIIPDSSDPVNTGHASVAVFTNAGVFLTCNGAWMSVGAGRARRQSSRRP